MIIEGLETSFYSHDGPQKQLATVYMKTYCQTCKEAGFICPVGPRWPGTAQNGQQWALSGDINICDCKPAPVFFAQRNMTMTMSGDDVARMNGIRETESILAYDHRFLLLDSLTNVPLARQRYRLEFNGEIVEGTTGDDGITRAIPTGSSSGPVVWHILGEDVQ